MTEPDRGESYLEIQMDRTTIVLAALGVLACMVVAFLLGSWTASRKAAADKAAATVDADRAFDDVATDGGAVEQDVDAEPSFGGRPVSASGAPPLTAVPLPSSSPREGSTSKNSTSKPGGSTGITVASDGDDVKVEDVAAREPATTRSPAPKATTKAPAKAPAKTPTTTSSSTASSGAGWVVQVAAVQERSEAETLQKRLQGKGYPVRLLEEAGFVKVQVGPYAQKSEAQAAEKRLKGERGLATWVKKA